MLASYVGLAAMIVGVLCVAVEAGLCGTDILRWALLHPREHRELRRRFIPYELQRLIWQTRMLAAVAFAVSAGWHLTHP